MNKSPCKFPTATVPIGNYEKKGSEIWVYRPAPTADLALVIHLVCSRVHTAPFCDPSQNVPAVKFHEKQAPAVLALLDSSEYGPRFSFDGVSSDQCSAKRFKMSTTVPIPVTCSSDLKMNGKPIDDWYSVESNSRSTLDRTPVLGHYQYNHWAGEVPGETPPDLTSTAIMLWDNHAHPLPIAAVHFTGDPPQQCLLSRAAYPSLFLHASKFRPINEWLKSHE